MKKRFFIIIAAIAATISAAAQENVKSDKQTTGLEKGFYCNVELAADLSYDKNVSLVFNDRNSLNFAYDLTMAFGYRFIPQFTLAAGFGGTANTYSWDASIPVFLRLRSDILDRNISPYVQLDLGWNFFAPSTNSYYANKPTIDDLNSELSYKYSGSTRDKYIYDYIDSHRNANYNRLSNDQKYEWEQNMEKEAEASLNHFANGSGNYSVADEDVSTYGKSGLFSVLTIGVSWKVGTRTRMNAGISTGLVQYAFGEWARTNDLNNSTLNPSVWMGCADCLQGSSTGNENPEVVSWSGYRYNDMGERVSFEEEGEVAEFTKGAAVFARGKELFWDRFKPCGQIRIGITF